MTLFWECVLIVYGGERVSLIFETLLICIADKSSLFDEMLG
jgi:hypothetical protein